MTLPLAIAHEPTLPAVGDACWNRIGIHGDRSCPELVTHVLCRNCPVYSRGALDLLDRDPPATYVAEWTRHFATPEKIRHHDTESALIFRIVGEWLALPTAVVREVVEVRRIHPLPRRSGSVVLGLANVRGELLVCVSLARLLGIAPGTQDQATPKRTHSRLLVLSHDELHVVCPTDDVHGIERFHRSELKDVPATVAKAAARHSRAVVSWKGQSVGLLDEGLLLTAIRRGLA